MKPWRVIDSVVTYEDHWLKVRSDRCVTSSGRIIEPYHVLEYPDWVNVIALTSSTNILLVEEYRHGVAETVIGLPSGSMESVDENPEAAMRRELKEETGFTGGEFFQLGYTYANASAQTFLFLWFATIGIEPHQTPDPDPNEQIEIKHEDFITFVNYVLQGDIQFLGLHLATLCFAIHFILRSSRQDLTDLRRALRVVLLGAT